MVYVKYGQLVLFVKWHGKGPGDKGKLVSSLYMLHIHYVVWDKLLFS